MAGRSGQKIEIIGLTPDSVNSIVDEYREKEFDEPMPLFREVNLGKLCSSLKTPFLRPSRYETFEKELCYKASCLFALIIESHSFPQGNKRTAVGVLVNIGINNGYRFNLSDIKLYACAMGVTLLSKYGLFDEAVEEIYHLLLDSLQKQPGKPLSRITRNELKKEFEKFMITST